MARRLRGVSLGFLFVAVNILLVAGLVLLTSSRSISDLLSADEPAPAPTQTIIPAPTPTGTTPDPSPTATPTPTETAGPQADPQAMFGAGEPINVVVLGDQTGTDPNDWVGAWSRSLAEVRPVQLLVPEPADPTTYGAPVPIGVIEAAPGNDVIALRNASLVGATPGYVAPRVPLFVPTDTDLVLLNFGRSNTAGDISIQLAMLTRAVAEQAPAAQVRVIVQPSRQDGQPPLDDQVRAWAATTEVETIDVAAEFDAQGLTLTTVSQRDPLSVNILGSQIWATVVQEAVFGPLGAPTTSP